jgi:hypothetical protein
MKGKCGEGAYCAFSRIATYFFDSLHPKEKQEAGQERTYWPKWIQDIFVLD